MQDMDSKCQHYISDLVVGAKTFLNPKEFIKKDKKLNVAIRPIKQSTPVDITKGKVWIQDDNGVLTESSDDLAEPAFSQTGSGCEATNVVKEVFYNFEYKPY